eukprot:scaffold1954_cov268-Pinguiococcus_pyrenoidosus.AAC.54
MPTKCDRSARRSKIYAKTVWHTFDFVGLLLCPPSLVGRRRQPLENHVDPLGRQRDASEDLELEVRVLLDAVPLEDLGYDHLALGHGQRAADARSGAVRKRDEPVLRGGEGDALHPLRPILGRIVPDLRIPEHVRHWHDNVRARRDDLATRLDLDVRRGEALDAGDDGEDAGGLLHGLLKVDKLVQVLLRDRPSISDDALDLLPDQLLLRGVLAQQVAEVRQAEARRVVARGDHREAVVHHLLVRLAVQNHRRQRIVGNGLLVGHERPPLGCVANHDVFMLPAVVEHPAHLRDDAPDRHPQRHALAHDQGPLAHHLGDVYGQIEILPNVHAEHDLPRDPQRGQVHHGRDVHALPLVRLQQPRDALVRVLAHGLDVVLQVRRVEELGEERVIVPVLVALAGHQALAKERAEHMRVVLRLGHPAIRQYLPHGRRIGDMQQGL